VTIVPTPSSLDMPTSQPKRSARPKKNVAWAMCECCGNSPVHNRISDQPSGPSTAIRLAGGRLEANAETEISADRINTFNASIILPFFLGACLALFLYPRLSDDSVTFTGFALFLGAAMSVTAFPVLARVLTEHGC